MKGTLLILALLVTRELGFQTAEACPLFYALFSALGVGDKTLLYKSLDVAKFTEEEKAAMAKIQDCYNEAGFLSKALDLIVMSSITTSPECMAFYIKDIKDSV